MAESSKFGGSRLQFGDSNPGGRAGETAECSRCEAMLADALDGALSAADQTLFDRHTAACGPCQQLLADAQRGAAWLQMLRQPKPEPPALLLERILAQTSGHIGEPIAAADLAGEPAVVGLAGVPSRGVVLPFRERAWAAIRRSGLGQIALQPRLAMTAAMAFFSLALTMDITGLRVQDMKAANFRPSNLKRGLYSAKARLVQSYEGLRVVYELESRVRDMESVGSDDVQNGSSRSAPASKQPATPAPAQPGRSAPEKKGSSQGAPSGGVHPQQPGPRMSLLPHAPAREFAELNWRPLQAAAEAAPQEARRV